LTFCAHLRTLFVSYTIKQPNVSPGQGQSPLGMVNLSVNLYRHGMNLSPFPLRVGILGCPARPTVAWTYENLARLKTLGFNAIQLNLAWEVRPADEPLTLENVVDIPELCNAYQSVPISPVRSDRSPERSAQRKADLRARIQLCKEAGMRTIFHFGAPNNGFYDPAFPPSSRGQLAHCLLDGKTQDYYACLVETFAAEYLGVDDLLMYTYDQNAWLCNEFGSCPRCAGIPIHERVTTFVNQMAET